EVAGAHGADDDVDDDRHDDHDNDDGDDPDRHRLARHDDAVRLALVTATNSVLLALGPESICAYDPVERSNDDDTRARPLAGRFRVSRTTIVTSLTCRPKVGVR